MAVQLMYPWMALQLLHLWCVQISLQNRCTCWELLPRAQQRWFMNLNTANDRCVLYDRCRQQSQTVWTVELHSTCCCGCHYNTNTDTIAETIPHIAELPALTATTTMHSHITWSACTTDRLDPMYSMFALDTGTNTFRALTCRHRGDIDWRHRWQRRQRTMIGSVCKFWGGLWCYNTLARVCLHRSGGLWCTLVKEALHKVCTLGALKIDEVP